MLRGQAPHHPHSTGGGRVVCFLASLARARRQAGLKRLPASEGFERLLASAGFEPSVACWQARDHDSNTNVALQEAPGKRSIRAVASKWRTRALASERRIRALASKRRIRPPSAIGWQARFEHELACLLAGASKRKQAITQQYEWLAVGRQWAATPHTIPWAGGGPGAQALETLPWAGGRATDPDPFLFVHQS